jgi:hypothetical protein
MALRFHWRLPFGGETMISFGKEVIPIVREQERKLDVEQITGN